MELQLILDRYRPLTELASGGFADVLLAFDTKMQRRVVIKRLPLQRASGGPDRTTGLAEARTAALLAHPNIVDVYEWDTDRDEAFIIMEYVDGVSLAEILDAEGPPGLDAAATVVEGVAAALAHAHGNGVLHLDVKPENVLVTRDGRVLVTDFGVAAVSSSLGHGPTAGGTLGFMPLEQLEGGAVDERSDVWAFGALCFELIADANPFHSDTVEGAVFKARVIEPPLPSDFDGTLPSGIDSIVLTALSPDPGDRYPTASAFADRLTAYLGDPAAGADHLADVVTSLLAEEGRRKPDWDVLGLWDRTRPYLGLAVRFLGGGVSGWLAWVGLSAFALPFPATAVVTAMAVAAGIAAPSLGMALGLLAFAMGLAWSVGWLAGLAFAVPAGVAWWFAGRRDASLLGGLAAPLLGALRSATAAPLLLGFASKPLEAAVAATAGAAITMLAAAAAGSRAPYLDVPLRWLADPLGTRLGNGNLAELVSTPAPLAPLVAWGAAAATMSFICRRATRASAITGWALGMGIMYAGYSLADTIAAGTGADTAWAGDAVLPHLAASSILVLLVIAAGAPPRAEEE